MSGHVIEGTWEEIKRHDAELMGRQVRLTIKPEKPTTRKPNSPTAQPKKLIGYGAFKGMFGGTEAIIAEKQAEIELEERNL
ncbi:MAG: hypothetical protein ACLQVD_09030 [Capsulimonadaceae bacterium]